MRAEPALTERVSSGPRRGPKLGASQSWRARLEQSAALLAPVALIVGLALAGGGNNVSGRHLAGLAGWLGAGSLPLRRAAPATRLAGPFHLAPGPGGGLSLPF